ncbi:hypothetical protein NSPZN2_100251 [Nitrospira defluvii]|uniref:Secreted protein n=1 Tax=Nitrospira defluvii TaxID=330214 RepID=A0ABN7L8K8_9BACT|nr:hypothetical protein NSPZN2_100251 [Nitrospira defluvii]
MHAVLTRVACPVSVPVAEYWVCGRQVNGCIRKWKPGSLRDGSRCHSGRFNDRSSHQVVQILSDFSLVVLVLPVRSLKFLSTVTDGTA